MGVVISCCDSKQQKNLGQVIINIKNEKSGEQIGNIESKIGTGQNLNFSINKKENIRFD